MNSLLVAGAHPLATLNACLNATAALLLVVGYVLILRRRERAHRNVMLAAFAVSVAFLTSYLAYHVWPVGAKATPFPGEGLMLVTYRVILVSHIILAAAVPFLAIRTIWLGFADRRRKHRRLGRVTFYIWLYVSVTGVLIYWMLYHLYPQPSEKSIIVQAALAAQPLDLPP
jgi:uncharacterized membrane protein YozB (DUF420 family)